MFSFMFWFLCYDMIIAYFYYIVFKKITNISNVFVLTLFIIELPFYFYVSENSYISTLTSQFLQLFFFDIFEVWCTFELDLQWHSGLSTCIRSVDICIMHSCKTPSGIFGCSQTMHSCNTPSGIHAYSAWDARWWKPDAIPKDEDKPFKPSQQLMWRQSMNCVVGNEEYK